MLRDLAEHKAQIYWEFDMLYGLWIEPLTLEDCDARSCPLHLMEPV